MKDAGYYTVSSILMRTKKALCEVKGLSEPKVCFPPIPSGLHHLTTYLPVLTIHSYIVPADR